MTGSTVQITSSDVIAISSAVIALCALITTIWQGVVSRRHNRMSVKPVLDFDREVRPKEMFSISLKNHGVGVAIIQSIRIENNGKRLPFGADAVNEIAKDYPISLPSFEFSEIDPRTALSAGAEVLLFSVKLHGVNDDDRSALLKMFNESRIHVRYESVYKEEDGVTSVLNIKQL